MDTGVPGTLTTTCMFILARLGTAARLNRPLVSTTMIAMKDDKEPFAEDVKMDLSRAS